MFAVTYVAMLVFSKCRPYIALDSALIYIVTGIGSFRREGYTVKNADFFKIGIPFILTASIPAYIYIWIFCGE